MLSKNGLSPIISSVILIAFALTIAAVLGGWFTSLTRTQTETVSGGTASSMNCTKGVLTIVATKFSDNNSNVIISNTGMIDLTDGFDLYVEDDSDNFDTGNISTDLLKGQTTNISTVNGYLTGSSLNLVRVTSRSCPSVWVEKTSGFD